MNKCFVLGGSIPPNSFQIITLSTLSCMFAACADEHAHRLVWAVVEENKRIESGKAVDCFKFVSNRIKDPLTPI